MNESHCLNMVCGFGIYHVIAIAPLKLLVLPDKVLALLGAVHANLQLSGDWPVMFKQNNEH